MATVQDPVQAGLPWPVRLAGAETPLRLDGDLELLSLSGTIAANGAHTHLRVADVDGRVPSAKGPLPCKSKTA